MYAFPRKSASSWQFLAILFYHQIIFFDFQCLPGKLYIPSQKNDSELGSISFYIGNLSEYLDRKEAM